MKINFSLDIPHFLDYAMSIPVVNKMTALKINIPPALSYLTTNHCFVTKFLNFYTYRYDEFTGTIPLNHVINLN